MNRIRWSCGGELWVGCHMVRPSGDYTSFKAGTADTFVGTSSQVLEEMLRARRLLAPGQDRTDLCELLMIVYGVG